MSGPLGEGNFGPLYDSGFGPLGPDGVRGGSMSWQRDGSIHHNVYGDGLHFSWDSLGGDTWGMHMTDQGLPRGDPGRIIK